MFYTKYQFFALAKNFCFYRIRPNVSAIYRLSSYKGSLPPASSRRKASGLCKSSKIGGKMVKSFRRKNRRGFSGLRVRSLSQNTCKAKNSIFAAKYTLSTLESSFFSRLFDFYCNTGVVCRIPPHLSNLMAVYFDVCQ